jgi:hypothetical protein
MVYSMTTRSMTDMINSPSAPYWLVLVALILVGSGVGLWIHFGAGLAAAGLLTGAFAILQGSD